MLQFGEILPIKIKIHERILKKIENQRLCWLKIAVFFLPSLFLFVLEWNNILSLGHNLWLLSVFVLSLIAAFWWFWTMAIIKVLIDYKIIEIQILRGTINDLKSIQDEFRNLK